MGLQQGWFAEEPGLSGAGTADHQNVLVSGVLGLFRTAFHSQALRHSHGDVLEEIRVNKGCNIRRGAP